MPSRTGLHGEMINPSRTGAHCCVTTPAYEKEYVMNHIKALASFLLMSLFATSVSANITYNVNRTVGGGSVSGFIVTDGTLGMLSTANLVDWSFDLSAQGSFGPVYSFIQSSLDQGTYIGGSGVNATATDLYFDFDSGGDSLIVFQSRRVGTTDAAGTWCLTSGTTACPRSVVLSPRETVTTSDGFRYITGQENRSGAGVVSIASASAVPEPETYAMMLAGLGLLGFAARRRKQGVAG